MTPEQRAALMALCHRYHVEFCESDYSTRFDLPDGYVAGWAGGWAIQGVQPTIYVGCSPDGRISS